MTIFAVVLYGVMCVACNGFDPIPKLTDVEKLVYKNDYDPAKWFVPTTAESVFGASADWYNDVLVMKRTGLFVHPLHEQRVPTMLCSVDIQVYNFMRERALIEMLKRTQLCYSTLQASCCSIHKVEFMYRNEPTAIFQLREISQRLIAHMPHSVEVFLCLKYYDYPDDIWETLQHYYQAVPVQDVVTCAQFAEVYMSESPFLYDQAEIVCLKYDKTVVRVTCPIIQKILKYNSEFDLFHRQNIIRFNGKCDQVPDKSHEGYVPHCRTCQ
jgi:hypothetical protein